MYQRISGIFLGGDVELLVRNVCTSGRCSHRTGTPRCRPHTHGSKLIPIVNFVAMVARRKGRTKECVGYKRPIARYILTKLRCFFFFRRLSLER
jgi:hypothetical protein